MIATGVVPNTAYEYEHRGTFVRAGDFYQPNRIGADGQRLLPVSDVLNCKSTDLGFLSSYQQDALRVSLLGDLHSAFFGSVVKALASAKRVYPSIMQVLSLQQVLPDVQGYHDFVAGLTDKFNARLIDRQSLGGDFWLFVVAAPLQVEIACLGELFRLKKQVVDPVLLNESCALQPLFIDREKQQFLFVLDHRLPQQRALLSARPGDPLGLMGPTGVRYKLHDPLSKVLIIADDDGLVNAIALANGHLSKDQQVIIWWQSAGRDLSSVLLYLQAPDCIRRMDVSVQPQMTDQSLGRAVWPELLIELRRCQQVVLLGQAQTVKSNYLRCQQMVEEAQLVDIRFIGSVMGPMQCLLKGVCAKCFQWQVDPNTGERTKAVFSCSWQYQALELVDLDHLIARQTSQQLMVRMLSVESEFAV